MSTNRGGAGDNYIQEILCSGQNEALGDGLDIQEDIIVKEGCVENGTSTLILWGLMHVCVWETRERTIFNTEA